MALSAAEAIGAWTYTLNYVIPLAVHPEPSAILHAWSLAVEEQFYLLWPLVLSIALTHAWVRHVLVSAILLVFGWPLMLLVGGVSRVYLRLAFDTRAAILATGCLLAFLPPMRPGGMLAVACLALLIATTLWPLKGLGYEASDAVDGTLIAVLLAQSMAWHPRWMGPAVLRWLVDRLYLMYLWHAWGLVLAARSPLGIRLGTGPVIYQGPVGSLNVRVAWLPFGGTIQLLDADAHEIGYRDLYVHSWRLCWVPGAWRAPLISLGGPLTSLAVAAIFMLATPSSLPPDIRARCCAGRFLPTLAAG